MNYYNGNSLQIYRDKKLIEKIAPIIEVIAGLIIVVALIGGFFILEIIFS